MNFYKVIRSSTLWAVVFAMAVTVMFYLRSVDHVCVGDELRYFYKFNLNPGENYFNFSDLRAVHTVSDIWHSQINHYLTVNGRSLVHAIEQLFSGILGVKWFYLINTMIFLLTVSLFEIVTASQLRRDKGVAFIISVIIFLYLFPVPGRLWFSINLALNYLWPSCAALGWMIIMFRLFDAKKIGKWACGGIVLLSFFLGWSNEAFSLPLSGAIGVWMLLNIKKFRGQILLAIIPLWVGAIIMLCSPGNWLRAESSVEHIQSFLTILLQLKLFWMLAAVAVVAGVMRPHLFIGFVRSNYVLWLALAFAVCMGVVAHTAVRAFTAIELFSAVILARGVRSMIKDYGRCGGVALTIVSCLVLAHQWCVTTEHCRQYRSIVDAVKLYQTSKTGTVRYDFSESPLWLSPFVYSQVPTSEGADYEWRLLGLSRGGTSAKPFTALRTSDYDSLPGLVENTDSTSSLFPFWKVGDSYIAVYHNGMPGRYEATLDNGSTVTISRRLFTDRGRSYSMLIPPEGRRITAVRPFSRKP